jgi:hypothetical protein
MASISTSLDPVENIFAQLIGNVGSVRFMKSGSYGLGLKITLHNDYDSPITLISLDNRTQTGASADGKIRNIFLKLVPLHSQQNGSDAWAMQSTNDPGASRTIISTFIQEFETEVKTQIDLYKKTGYNLSPICPAIYFSAKLDGRDSNTEAFLNNLASNYSGNQLVDGFWDELKAEVSRGRNRKIGIILMPCFPFPPMHQAWNFFSDRDMRIGVSDIREDQRILSKYFAIENYATRTTDATYGNIKYILKDYTDLDTDRRKGLFYIVQIVSHMITMYDEGVYHGDLHFGNVLINPHELACTLPLLVDSTNTTRIDVNSPFLGKVYIIDFGAAVSREREMEQDESFGDKIMKILTTRGSHNFSPISYFIYDWFVSLFVLRNSTDTSYLLNASDYKPLLIEENVAKMEELVNAFMDSKHAYEGGMLSVLTSDPEKAPLIAEYRQIIEGDDPTSVLIGGDVYSPEIIEGTPSILESRSKMVDSQDKSFIMTDDLVNDIFRYTDNVLREIKPQFIQTIEQSIK